MLKSVEGVYRNGKIELSVPVTDVSDETPVIVTFIEPKYVDLLERGISERDAINLRARLASFAEDWDSPEMDVYDNYDNAKTRPAG